MMQRCRPSSAVVARSRPADVASPTIDGASRVRSPGVSWVRAGRPRPAVLIGAASLLLAIVSSVALPPNLVVVALGAVAVVGLSREPRLGVLPAAFLALIAVPYGRAAENGLAEVFGIPLRFQDGVVAAAFVLAIPAIRQASFRTWISRLIAAFLVVGAIAAVIGVASDQAARDLFRDARWWALYGFGLLALWGAIDRRAVVRGLLIGATTFAIVLFSIVLLPTFPGGLEARALTYDWGSLRLQFSNSIFLVPALAYVATRLAVRLTRRDALWLLILATAIVLSVTRMSIVAGLGTVGLAFLWAVWRHRRAMTPSQVVRHGALIAAILVASLGGTLGLVIAGSAVQVPSVDTSTREPTDSQEILDRIMFQDPNSSVGAVERGRFSTYRAALKVIGAAPVTGSGLGTLVPIDFTFGGSQPSTPGMQPGVDDAYLTVAMKAGLIGAAVFAAMMCWPLTAIVRRRRDRLAWWLLPGWIGVLGLTLTQSFATTGYGPFGLALLLVCMDLRPARAPHDA